MKKNPILLVILGILAVLVYNGSPDAADDPILSAGFLKFIESQKAPGFQVEDVGGRRVMLEDYKGKVVLLFFWTTW